MTNNIKGHKKFREYLKKIGEIPKDIEFDFEKDHVVYRYLDQATVHKDGSCSYGCCRYGEVLVNNEVIGYFENDYKNWFNKKYINNLYGDGRPIKRIWGVCHYIWSSD